MSDGGSVAASSDVRQEMGFCVAVPRQSLPWLGAILLLAAGLRGWDVGTSGFITPYYYAGVRSMMQSWHNLFFNAFDPAGMLAIDKPPVAFWLQAASAKLFGFNPWSVLLPQAIEGVAAVGVLYALVARRFGAGAGLLAALFLALDPVSVAVGRSNGTDACLVLVLLLAAAAVDRAIAATSRVWLLAAAALVGLAFNVKMLAAVGVVPVFALLYMIAAMAPWRRRLLDLALAAVVFVGVALSWCVAFDLTPPERRPYADSSTGNSMLELAFGHNGLQRFVLPARAAPRDGSPPAAVQDPADAASTPPRARSIDYVPAGFLRLTAPHLAAQAAWMLPLALIGGIAAWLYRREFGARVQLALWGGWALSYGIVLSAADGFFHPHYLSLLAPPLCAVAAIGIAAMAACVAAGSARWWLPLAVLATAAWQARIVLDYFPAPSPSLTAGLAAAFAVVLAALVWRSGPLNRIAAGLALLLLSAAPAAWAVGTIGATDTTGFAAARPPFAGELDEAARLRWAARWGGFMHHPLLTDYLQRNRGDARFLLATVNARQAAPVIVDSGEPVLALGGFGGGTPVMTAAMFAEAVERGEIAFALIYREQPGLIRQSAAAQWVRRRGRLVDPIFWRNEPERPGLTPAQVRAASGLARAMELYDLLQPAAPPEAAQELAVP